MRVREQENEREQKRKCKRDSVKVPAHLPVFHPFTVSCRCRTAFYLTLFLHPVACTHHLKMSNVLIVSFFSHPIYQAWVFHDFVALKSVTIDHSDHRHKSKCHHPVYSTQQKIFNATGSCLLTSVMGIFLIIWLHGTLTVDPGDHTEPFQATPRDPGC